MNRIILAAIPIVLCGCSTSRSLVGEWSNESPRIGVNSLTFTDTTFTWSAEPMGSKISLTSPYTYNADGVLILSSPKLEAGGVAGAMLGNAKPQPIEVTVSWKNDREILLTPKGGSMAPNGNFKRS